MVGYVSSIGWIKVADQQVIPDEVALFVGLNLVAVGFGVAALVLFVLEQKDHAEAIASFVELTFVESSVLGELLTVVVVERKDML